MTTFTALKDEEAMKASISLNPEHTIAKIDPLIYGGFTEHMGRCIYGGLYDPKNPNTSLITPSGFRSDVLSCMRDELSCPIVRYPGGNFVATYRWQDGIGPVSERPCRPELAWSGVESNAFGTDEFMAWCAEARCEPYLCLNMGTGTLEDGLAWVEYCNGSKNTYYADLRRKNGRQEPYNVKYWALGNEMWGPWQVEQHSKEDYAKKAIQWAKAIKLLDPSVKLILCGKDGASDWDRYVLQECLKWVDMHSIHYYSAGDSHYKNISSATASARNIQIASSLVDLARCELDLSAFPDVSRITTRARSETRPKICVDEWNVWDPARAPGDQGAEERYTLSDALAVGVWLNTFVRHASELGMCTIAQSVNVIAPLMTTEAGVWRQATYFPLLLAAAYLHGESVAVHVKAPTYGGETFPEWARDTIAVPMVDAAASRHEGHLNLSVVNADLERDFLMPLEGVKKGVEVQVFVVGGEGTTVDMHNGMDSEVVNIKESTWSVEEDGAKFKFQKHSYTLLRWKY
ncbi:glycoside hydrolase family 51 protein [Zalerion maritima]|uniref:non-reducing end alpha-L-arabinofuranosidase n=1 Tax=Zalerion maritima TaxID=339359 RepID=A0AAD5WR42_9PEZI|nr:glycoside hydrolase family 51 protein [Zalerion maritima]